MDALHRSEDVTLLNKKPLTKNIGPHEPVVTQFIGHLIFGRSDIPVATPGFAL